MFLINNHQERNIAESGKDKNLWLILSFQRWYSHQYHMSTQQATPSPIKPPFTKESAEAKVKAAENLWNTKDPEKVVLAYTPDTKYVIIIIKFDVY